MFETANQRAIKRYVRRPVRPRLWLRRRSVRCHSLATWKRNVLSRAVARHAEVPAIPSHYRLPVLALIGDRVVLAPTEFELDRLEFGSQAFGTGQPQDHGLVLPGLPTAVGEAQEVEGLRFALSAAASVL
jgi:hypothetical protein